jgi:hypothetical protein
MSQRPQRGKRRGSSRAQAPDNVATNTTADPVVNLSDAAAPAASVDIVVEGGDAQGHNDEEINAAAPEATVATSEGPARSGRANGTFSSTPLAQMFPGIVKPPVTFSRASVQVQFRGRDLGTHLTISATLAACGTSNVAFLYL